MRQEVGPSQRMHAIRAVCFCSVVLVLALAHVARGQNGLGETIDVRSGFARVSVESRVGTPQLSDFKISWKGQTQPVREVFGGPGSPIEIGIAFDISASMAPSLDAMRIAIAEFLRSELSAADRVFVASISDRFVLRAEGLEASLATISSISADARPGVRPTRFLDGVDKALGSFRNSSARAVLVVASDGCDSLQNGDEGGRILTEASDMAVPIVLIAPSRQDCRNTTCRLTEAGEFECSDKPAATPSIRGRERDAAGPIRGGVDVRSASLSSPATIARDQFLGRLKAGGGMVLFARSDSDWIRGMDSVHSLLNRQWSVVFEPTSEAVRSSEVRVRVQRGPRRPPSEREPTEARRMLSQPKEPQQAELTLNSSIPNATRKEAKPRTSSPIDEQVRVEVVNVDVVATDKRGRRILDIPRSEFLLEVDGRPQAIDYYSPPSGVTIDYEEPLALPAPGSIAGPRGTVFMILDRTTLEARTLKQVVDSFKVLTHSTSSQGRTFVVASFAESLTMHTSGASEPGEVDRALDAVVRAGATGQLRRLERRQLAGEILGTGRTNIDFLISQIRALEDREVSRQIEFLSTIQDLVTSSAVPDEPNTLLIATEGMSSEPERYLRDLVSSVASGTAAARMFSSDGASSRNVLVLEELDKLSQTLQARRVTSYTLTPATGFNGPSNAEFRTPGRGSAGTPREDQALAEFAANVAKLADATGGSKIAIFSDLDKRLEAIALDRESTYSLGFTTGPEAGFEIHKIRVAASRPGASLRYRTSYRRQSQADLWDAALAAAARTGLVESSIPIELRAGKPALAPSGRNSRVLVTLIIPLEQLDFQTSVDRTSDTSVLSVRLAVCNSEGTLTRGESEDIEISIPHEDLDRVRHDFWSHRTEVEVPTGQAGIGALVVEKRTGVWATSSLVISIDN